MTPSKQEDLNELHRTNQDLEALLRKHKELSGRLEGLRKRHMKLVDQDVSSPKYDRSKNIIDLLKKKDYRRASTEMDAFEKIIEERESSRETILAFNKRFHSAKKRWYDLISKRKLKDDGSLVKVAEAANRGDFQEAAKQIDRMDLIMGEADGHNTLKLRTKENYELLMELEQKLMDDETLVENGLVEKERIRSMIKKGRMSEANDLIKKKIIILQDLKKDHNSSRDLYNELAKEIEDFNDIGYMDVPIDFKEGIREYESGNYKKAAELFRRAEDTVRDIIEEALPKANYRLDLRGTKIRTNRWEEGSLVISNEGDLDIGSIKLEAASDNYRLDLDEEEIRLKTGREQKLPIRINFTEEGLVPIKMRMEVFSLDGKHSSERKKKFRIEVSPQLPKTTVDLTKKEPAKGKESLKKKVGEVYKLKEEKEIDLKEGDFYSYRIVDKLGAGGFSTVYLVKAGGSEFAMKTPKDIGIEGDETVEINKRELLKFKKEASIWAMITDTIPDDVVKLIDIGLEPFPWFVMELADGSLRDELKDASLDRRIEIATEILTRFDRVHHLGIVHRDIKPENILFINGSAKITDFGISKIVSSTSKSTVGTSGTYFYMSPEQISRSRFGPVDWRTDIWQLGILTYEILTDRLPFEADDPYEVSSNILHDEPIPISNFNEELKELDAPLLRSLHKDKDKRYQSAVEMRFYIEKALGL